MKYCDICGAELQDSDMTCPVCGNILASEQPAPEQPAPEQLAPEQPAPVQPIPVQPVNYYQPNGMGMPVNTMQQNYMGAPVTNPQPIKKKKSKAVLIILVIAVILALAGIFVYFKFIKDKDESTDKKDQEVTEQTTEQAVSQSTTEAVTEQPADSDGYLSQTVIIYMVGSDLESQYGAASIDIDEIENSGIDTDENNVILYTGGSKNWNDSSISEDNNCIFELDGSSFSLVDTLDKDNMGEAATLSSYLNWAYENYKTDSYALILWDHGGGPNVGYGCDENYDYDCLTLSEMSTALADSPFNENNKLEWVSFDACLMATIEVAEVFEPYADYLIGSQESEPGYGHYYSYLECLNDGNATGDVVGRRLADDYMDYYEQVINQYGTEYECDITISCLDLSKLSNVTSAMDTLFADAETGIVNGQYGEITRRRTQTKSFGVYTTSNSYDLIDMHSLAEQLKELYPSSDKLASDIEELVIINETNVDDANGVSVYYPSDNNEYLDYWMADYGDISASEQYARFLRVITGEEEAKIQTHGQQTADNSEVGVGVGGLPGVDSQVAYADVDWTLSTDNLVDRSDDGFSVKLTDEQKAYFASARCFILRKEEEDEEYAGEENYGMKANVKNLMYDDNSEIFIDPSIYMVDINGAGNSVLAVIPEKDISIIQVYAIVSRLAYEDENDDNLDYESANITINLRLSDDGKNYDILSAFRWDSVDGETENDINSVGNYVADKDYIDLNEWDKISIVYIARSKTLDSNGALKSVDSWDSPGYVPYFSLSIAEDDMQFSKGEILDSERSGYYCQYIIKDIYGYEHPSELISLD